METVGTLTIFVQVCFATDKNMSHGKTVTLRKWNYISEEVAREKVIEFAKLQRENGCTQTAEHFIAVWQADSVMIR